MPDPIPHESQITPAHVLEVIQKDVIPRLDTLEGTVADLATTVKDAGLNGHTPYLKAFLEQYAATYVSRQAWQTVRSDIAHRLRFLSQPKAWVRTIFYATLGGIGWELVSTIAAHPPHI